MDSDDELLMVFWFSFKNKTKFNGSIGGSPEKNSKIMPNVSLEEFLFDYLR